MKTAKSSEKREKSTAEFIIVVVLLGFLMKLFIGFYFSQEESIANAGFKTLAQNFKNTVVVVHAQWLMDKQPRVVKLSSLNSKDKVKITVNKKGWLDTEQYYHKKYRTSACENIWQLAMNIPMSLMNFSIAAIEIHDDRWRDYHKCRYIISTGEYFEYSSVTGKVTQVALKNG
jgi:hypothetical protein